ncbi:unannotated protein [freshwater metagenome]|uniref:Unannotated protein n=1 Tax=freshwater metagenome TaxID=449393 RepID=A0A6J7EUT4_9ZZZZ|nr:hypothetical protein [Actinomycetota bacterium]
MSSKKKVIAVVITTAALTVGSFGVATAASKTAKITRTSVTTASGQSVTGKPSRSAELSALLAELVTKGTITKAQADAIVAAATAAEAARDALRPEKGPKGNGKNPMDQKLAIVSSTLGIDSATVLTRLKAGETLAAIAGAKKDALIAALVADETKRIDADVTAGKLTAAQATEIKAGLVAHVTAEVNATAPVGGPQGPMGDRGGKGDKGGRGHGGPKGGPMGGGMGAPTIPTPTSTTASKA